MGRGWGEEGRGRKVEVEEERVEGWKGESARKERLLKDSQGI